MFYRENGQFKASYAADQRIFAVHIDAAMDELEATFLRRPPHPKRRTRPGARARG